MNWNNINIGAFLDDPTAERVRDAFDKVNDGNTYLFPIVNGGTKITEIGRAWIGGAGSNRQIAADSINAGASFNIPANHLGMVRFYSGIPLEGFRSRLTYFAIKTGAGTYGSGGTQLNASNVVEVNTVFENIETVYELGNIGNVAIESFVNTSGAYVIQDVAKFTATQNDIDKEWLFIGGSGTWGDGAQQTNAEMFLDLAEQELIPEEQIPPVHITRATFAELVTDMAQGALLKDFIYRSLADGYFHFKGYSDPPFSGDLVPIVPPIPADAEWLANFPSGLVKFDKHYSVGTPTSAQTGALTLDLTGAKVGRTVLMYYTGTALPSFVTQWLQETDDNFIANETCYIGLHLHKLDGVNSVITGVVNNL